MNGFLIPKATLGRLPTYLQYLKSLPKDEHATISATAIAKGLALGDVQVRKDLAAVSGAGKPKIGYEREALICDLERHLGYDKLTSAVLAPDEGDTVLDLCACPGGKSFGAAIAMNGTGRVIARDIHESKLSLIRSGALRLGLSSVSAEVRDATLADPDLVGRVDRVICDVPCSGLGVIAKKPDLRYRGLSSVAELSALSQKILEAAAPTLRKGGVMVFSTCTLTREENEEAVAAFLAAHPEFSAEDFTVGGLSSSGGMLTLWPHRHGTDGFFMAKLRRT